MITISKYNPPNLCLEWSLDHSVCTFTIRMLLLYAKSLIETSSSIQIRFCPLCEAEKKTWAGWLWCYRRKVSLVRPISYIFVLSNTAETADQNAQAKFELNGNRTKEKRAKQQEDLQENIRKLLLRDREPPDNFNRRRIGCLNFLIRPLKDMFRKWCSLRGGIKVRT